jgi:hypothetical protein
MLATTHFEDFDFVVPALRNHSCLDRRATDERSTELDLFTFAHCKNLVEDDFGANVRRYLFYLDFFAGNNLVLLATGFYDRVHVDLT